MKNLKNLKNYTDFVNESELDTFMGKNILPDWLDSSYFGSVIEKIYVLDEGELYLILETDEDVWVGDFRYDGLVNDKYTFTDTNNEMEPFTFTKVELDEVLDSGEIYMQI